MWAWRFVSTPAMRLSGTALLAVVSAPAQLPVPKYLSGRTASPTLENQLMAPDEKSTGPWPSESLLTLELHLIGQCCLLITPRFRSLANLTTCWVLFLVLLETFSATPIRTASPQFDGDHACLADLPKFTMLLQYESEMNQKEELSGSKLLSEPLSSG